MINIAICICTRNRPTGLKKLLDSLQNMQIPFDIYPKIIVIENDSEDYCRNIVTSFSLKSKLDIYYYLEENIGLAFARNRSVKEAGDCDFCCFVDDDQVVNPYWLVELCKCQKEFNSDGVWGPNPPIFSNNVPDFIKLFYMPDIYNYGTIVRTAHTNCLMLRKNCLNDIEGPFDLRLNFSGGEDSYLTSLFSKKGYVIRFNPNALAYEIISDDRATIKYILKRTYRISNAGLYVRSNKYNISDKMRVLATLILRFSYGCLIALPFYVFRKTNRLKGLIKIINALGGFAFILGKRNQFYK